MRIVHTSDWHAGRMWKNRRRLDELEAALGGLGEYLETEGADLLLVSGDVFDTGAPIAEAEHLVFRFLRRVGAAKIRTIIIAGNHDSPERLQAWGGLAELAGVRVVARPCGANDGGIIRHETAAGETAIVAAVPFANSRDLVAATTLASNESKARTDYAEGLRDIVADLCSHFDAQAVNLLVAHTHISGSLLSKTEREVHVGEQWAATAQALPPNAHYVALGHIHRPQSVGAAASPTEYAGSPMQLDFGEEGQNKSFVVVEASPRAPAKMSRVPYPGTKPLRTVAMGLAELEARAPELIDQGWLRVQVPLELPDSDLNAKVRRLLPNAVAVTAILPELPEASVRGPAAGAGPIELFRAYFSAKHGRDPGDALLDAFRAVLADSTED